MSKAYIDTDTAVTHSRGAIEKLLNKHGIDTIRWTSLPDCSVLEFKSDAGSFALTVRFDLGDAKTPAQRERQVWRALYWYVKAKLEAVDFGLEDMLRAFMPYLITGPNRILIDDVQERVEQRAMGEEIALLPEARR